MFSSIMGKKQSKHKNNVMYSSVPNSAISDKTDLDVKRYTTVHQDAVNSVVTVGDDCFLSGSADKSLVLYKWQEGRMMQRWTGHHKSVTRVAYSPELEAYFSGSRDKHVNMWKRGTTTGGICEKVATSFVGHTLVVTGLAVGDNKVCSGSRDNSVRLWDIETGNCLANVAILRNLVTQIKWVPGQTAVAQTSEDKCLRIWDTRVLQEATTFPKKQYIQTSCDTSKDGNYVLTSSNGVGGQGCEATLWDLRSTKVVCEYRGHQQTVGGCAFLPRVSSSNEYIATCGNDSTIRIWNKNTQDCVSMMTIPGSGQLTSIAAGNDGSLCVTSLNGKLFVLTVLEDSHGQCKMQHNVQY
ncbi:WD repeat-containing protein 31-like isoform X2 [Amphiura filiformis]|uniref:WD repeat-containing protein 31-like isoform X2 n=1 Tax=Amphiura filiformis TaxID=82378 RepID=UPI003B221026